MRRTLTRKLIEDHLLAGRPEPGEPIELRIDQTLTQDATGTLVMLELEAMDVDRVRTELSVQYVDHNLLQEDHRNPDDHVFLRSACRRYGIVFSRPGNGVSHPVHQDRFGRPGKTLLGSDSHTPAAGAIGMLAMGAGGLQVAAAMAGHGYRTTMPRVCRIWLEGRLPRRVSAKDVVLELLRRHGVAGGRDQVFEYAGPGLAWLTAEDRHVICNMGTEMGCTTSVFPADAAVEIFLRRMRRPADHADLRADEGATYDAEETIRLDDLEPLIAMPSSPGNVVPVREVAGRPVAQAYLGSSANPGYRDFAVPARMVQGRSIHPTVSFDVNPASRRVLEDLTRDGHLLDLLAAGARLHQTGCNGCIGMGQAPATGRNSLRTVPRNFPGRSGTREDAVWLCSPETATAAALTGEITDPREVDDAAAEISLPFDPVHVDDALFDAPLEPEEARMVRLDKGPNIVSLPTLEPPGETLDLEVVLACDDDISTDEILPAGAEVLPYRSNLPAIAEFCFRDVAPDYVTAARRAANAHDGHAIVGGTNYGQGSSREHAALAPRHLGLRAVIADGFARIHRDNLIDFGVLPLVPADGRARDRLRVGDTLRFDDPLARLRRGERIRATTGDGTELEFEHGLSPHEREVIATGGLMAWTRERTPAAGTTAP